MEWTDEAIVLGTRRHGEGSVILEAMTRDHGRHLGLVRGGAGSRQRPILQPGNALRVVWRARLDEHLGHFSVEGVDLRAGAILTSPHAVYAITHLAAIARLLPERDPHADVYEALEFILGRLDIPREVAEGVVRFELSMLSELGFGLDLASCAATGETADLIYVSPKSGRAVSRAAGEAWKDRLLRLPGFLASDEGAPPSPSELADGFALTGYFLTRYALEPRGLKHADARAHFIAAVMRVLDGAR
jgi:DNA repair protein RecO (recombination protein O)